MHKLVKGHIQEHLYNKAKEQGYIATNDFYVMYANISIANNVLSKFLELNILEPTGKKGVYKFIDS